MSRVSMYALSLAASAVLSLPVFGQAVISTRAGVVHFFEGSVTVAGRPLEAHFGKFTTIPEGAELRTAQGRAEVVLTPGVFLRVADNSAIRLLSSDLANTRVELLSGSAMIESAESAVGTSVTLIYKDWSMHQANQGSYRVDADPPRLQVRGGTVEVSTAAGEPVSVHQGMDLPFTDPLTPVTSAAAAPDAFSDWSDGRAESITADNAIAADIQDPANISGSYAPADAFTYFPLLGYPSIAPPVTTYTGLYNTMNAAPSPLYQPGFHSIYLPGYTYRPSYLRIPATTGLGHTLYPPSRFSAPPVHPVTPRQPVVGHPITPPPAMHPVIRR